MLKMNEETKNQKILKGVIWGGSLMYGFEAKTFQQYNCLRMNITIGLGINFWFLVDWSKWNIFRIGIFTRLTIPTYSEIVGMHLMAHGSLQIFIKKPSIALGNQVCNQCFIWRKIIKNMLVIRKKIRKIYFLCRICSKI